MPGEVRSLNVKTYFLFISETRHRDRCTNRCILDYCNDTHQVAMLIWLGNGETQCDIDFHIIIIIYLFIPPSRNERDPLTV